MSKQNVTTKKWTKRTKNIESPSSLSHCCNHAEGKNSAHESSYCVNIYTNDRYTTIYHNSNHTLSQTIGPTVCGPTLETTFCERVVIGVVFESCVPSSAQKRITRKRHSSFLWRALLCRLSSSFLCFNLCNNGVDFGFIKLPKAMLLCHHCNFNVLSPTLNNLKFNEQISEDVTNLWSIKGFAIAPLAKTHCALVPRTKMIKTTSIKAVSYQGSTGASNTGYLFG